MKLAEISLKPVLHVASRMREMDRQEIFATRWSHDPHVIAELIDKANPPGFVALADDGEPVCVVGAHEMWPGVFSVFMFATDRWKEVSFDTTKAVKRILIPAVMSDTFVRGECKSLSTHEEAHRWLEVLGASKESEHPCYGKNGETFFTYSWTRQPAKTN